MINLRFIDDGGIVPWLIKTFTWSQISHVEFVVANGYLGASTAAPGGVAIRTFEYAKPNKEWFGTVNCSDAITKKVLDFAKSQVGKPYDYPQILGIVLHQDWGNKRSWFCSELIVAAFENASYPIITRDPWDRVTPAMVFQSSLVKIEGKCK
jgi:uncharacterized protein YycO